MTIGACYGGARLAAEGAGLVEKGGSWARSERVVTPDPTVRERYDELYVLYRELHAATMPIQHALAARREPQAASAVHA